ncbi:MAG: hypothetical protein IJ064_03265 [Bacteroidaceae bacterium]|nr:hypothetical protein [Bacteroidaceae bacterium]
MKNKTPFILAMLAVACLQMVSCSDQEELAGADYIDPVSVELLPAVGRQSLNVSLSSTRSTGAFERWSLDAEHWKQANFYTFGLLTENSFVHDHDFSNQSNHALWNQLMRILDAQGTVRFYDNNAPTQQVHRYYTNFRNRRYQFFTFHVDDATHDIPSKLSATKDEVTLTIDSINGYQDIMHGFAYHTDEELQTLFARMPNNDDTKLFNSENDNGRNYLYSATSGNRGVHPQFHLTHQMAMFDVKVQGLRSTNENKTYSFLQVILDTLIIKAPYKGTMTVAKNTWDSKETYNAAVANHEVMHWDKSNLREFYPNIKQQELKGDEPYLQHLDSLGYHVEWSELWKELYDSLIIDLSIPHHQIGTEMPVTLCDSIILPAVDSISIAFGYKYMFIEQDSTGKWVLNIPQTRRNSLNNGRNPTSLKLASGEPFRPGGKYTILIKVWGPEQISIEAITGEGWKKHDEDISLQQDEDNTVNKEKK